MLRVNEDMCRLRSRYDLLVYSFHILSYIFQNDLISLPPSETYELLIQVSIFFSSQKVPFFGSEILA